MPNSHPHDRVPFNLDTYIEGVESNPCFICEMLAGKNPHRVVYQDDFAVAFLNKFPVLYGYVLVAPCQHKEQVTNDFTKGEYLALQELIYTVSEAVKQVVPTERVYILSLGSQQGNSHVHWHIAPLPPGVPHREQQFKALGMEKGVLDIPEPELDDLAWKIKAAIDRG